MAGRAHQVVQGECISSIADRFGLPWQKIWDAPENDGLREAGRQPNLLLPGDRVHVPDIELEEHPGATDRLHRFVLSGTHVTVHLTLVGSHEPLADEPWQAEYPGHKLDGTTDGEGKLELVVPVSLAQVSLMLPGRRLRFTLALGHLDPAESLSGAHARMLNLGHADAKHEDARTRAALRGFQAGHGLDATGELDDDTISALTDAHGS